MQSAQAQYITSSTGRKKAVILPIREYQPMIKGERFVVRRTHLALVCPAISFQFKIMDEIKAARIEATRAYKHVR